MHLFTLRHFVGSSSDLRFVCLYSYLAAWTWKTGCSSVRTSVDIVTLGNIYPNMGGAVPFTGPAFETATEELQRLYGSAFEFSQVDLFDYRYADCVELAWGSDEMLSRWYYNSTRERKNMTVLIYPGCMEIYSTNRLAVGWNILMITTVSNGIILRDKSLSPTWITGSCVSGVNSVNLFSNLLAKFNWTTVYVVTDTSANPFYISVTSRLEKVLSEMSRSQLTTRQISTNGEVEFAPLLNEFRTTSRVLIFFGHGGPLRQLMLAASNMQMTNGEYVYMAIEQFENPLFGSFSWKLGDIDDENAKQAYRSLLLLSSDNSIYDAPSAGMIMEWKRRSYDRYNVSYDLNPYVMSSYSSVMIFGKALNETLVNDPLFNLSDGKEFAKKFLNQTFTFNYTEIYIDSVGERRTNLVVRDLDVKTGNFTTRLLQDKIGSRLITTGIIDWASVGNIPPINEPVCGYLGDRLSCRQTGNISANYGWIIAAVCCLLLIGVLAAVVLSKRCGCMKLEEETVWWKLSSNELFSIDSSVRSHQWDSAILTALSDPFA